MALLDNLNAALLNPNPLLQFGMGVLASNRGNYGALGPALAGGFQSVQKQREVQDRQALAKLEVDMKRQQSEQENQKLALQQAQRLQQQQAVANIQGLLSKLPGGPQRDITAGLLQLDPTGGLAANALTSLAKGPAEPPVTATQSDWLYAQQNPQFNQFLQSRLPPVTIPGVNEQGLQTKTIVPRQELPAYIGGRKESGLTSVTQAPKPVPEADMNAILGSRDVAKSLSTMRNALDAGVNTGFGLGTIQEMRAKYQGLPPDHPIVQFYTGQANAAAQIQSLIKGTPSNFDVQQFQKTLADFGKDENTNRALIDWQLDMAKTAVGARIANLQGNGVRVPAELQQMAQELGVGASDIPDPGQKVIFSTPQDMEFRNQIKAHGFDEASIMATMNKHNIGSFKELYDKLKKAGKIQ